MLTLHLSRFLSGKPPGPEMQKLNALLHQEPYATTAYCFYWFFLILLAVPFYAWGLMILLAYEVGCRYYLGFQKRRRIEPSSSETRELAVVVTGCDSGFGKELALRLSSEGFVVFAGCLQEASKEQFTMDPLIRPLVLDVTNDQHIQDCYQTVNEWLLEKGKKDGKDAGGKTRYLHALVNNAGAGKFGYIDWTTMPEYEFCMEVNCFSQIRMCKAFLPIFKRQATPQFLYQDGQILNMISMAGMISAGGLGMSAYEVSKHAAEAFTDGLRLEMKMFNVKVVAINPSFHRTPLCENARSSLRKDYWESRSPEIQKEYGPEFYDQYTKHVETMTQSTEWNFQVVVDVMLDAIQSTHPRAQILIGSDAKIMVGLRVLPQWLRHFVTQCYMPPQVPAFLKNAPPPT